MTEHDVRELREFRAGLADPAPERMARIGAKVINNDSRHRARRGLLVPAIVAASVVVVGIGAAVVAFDRPGSGGSGVPAGGASARTQPETADKTSSVPDPLAPAEHAAAVNLLERFANAAGPGPAPLTVPAGKLLYVRGAATQVYLHELWVDVNGGIPVMIRRSDDGVVTVQVPDPNNPKSDNLPEIAQRRAELDRLGASLDRPTPAFLAGLPTDPATMLALLRARDTGPWSADHSIVDFVRGFLYNNEPLITPQVRAALYRALAELPSVGSTGEMIDIEGHKVYAIAQKERGDTQELLLDADTGRVVGSRSGTFYDIWSYGVVNAPGETG
jgi:hypothetical protein